MTLKEKFLPFVDDIDLINDIPNKEWGLRNAGKCIEIADEFAIGFAEWLETLPPSRKVSMWSKNGELKGLFTMDNEQLLETYKKEKGL